MFGPIALLAWVLILAPGIVAASEVTTNTLGMRLVTIPAGSFTMGTGLDFNDGPPRAVTITKPFALGATEVTQAQYKQVMGANPSWFAYRAADRPVECASWFEAVEFCRRLSEKEGRTYRLPTEAEWEYACKAGVGWMAATNTGARAGVEDYAWTAQNTNTETVPVATRKANPWGLYDMLGNVNEWCADWYRDLGYVEADTTDPRGPAQCSNTLDQGGRVARGGSTIRGGMNCLRTHRCTSTCRNQWTPYAKIRSVGFRVVCE